MCVNQFHFRYTVFAYLMHTVNILHIGSIVWIKLWYHYPYHGWEKERVYPYTFSCQCNGGRVGKKQCRVHHSPCLLCTSFLPTIRLWSHKLYTSLASNLLCALLVWILSSLLSLPPHLNPQSYHSKLLLSHLPVEASLESIRAELAAGSGIDMDDNFLKIVHLRQNLEKVSPLQLVSCPDPTPLHKDRSDKGESRAQTPPSYTRIDQTRGGLMPRPHPLTQGWISQGGSHVPRPHPKVEDLVTSDRSLRPH